MCCVLWLNDNVAAVAAAAAAPGQLPPPTGWPSQEGRASLRCPQICSSNTSCGKAVILSKRSGAVCKSPAGDQKPQERKVACNAVCAGFEASAAAARGGELQLAMGNQCWRHLEDRVPCLVPPSRLHPTSFDTIVWFNMSAETKLQALKVN